MTHTVQAQDYDRSDPEPQLEQESAEELNVLGIIEQISLKTKKLENDPAIRSVIRVPEAESFKPVYLNPKIKRPVLQSLRSIVMMTAGGDLPHCDSYTMRGPSREGDAVEMDYVAENCTTGNGENGQWRIFTKLNGPGWFHNTRRTTNIECIMVNIYNYESELSLSYRNGSWTARAKLTVHRDGDWFRQHVHSTHQTLNL